MSGWQSIQRTLAPLKMRATMANSALVIVGQSSKGCSPNRLLKKAVVAIFNLASVRCRSLLNSSTAKSRHSAAAHLQRARPRGWHERLLGNVAERFEMPVADAERGIRPTKQTLPVE
jgi:hypothetical protein